MPNNRKILNRKSVILFQWENIPKTFWCKIYLSLFFSRKLLDMVNVSENFAHRSLISSSLCLCSLRENHHISPITWICSKQRDELDISTFAFLYDRLQENIENGDGQKNLCPIFWRFFRMAELGCREPGFDTTTKCLEGKM